MTARFTTSDASAADQASRRPFVVMVSERLGFVQPRPEPATDPDYLRELTSQLPEFVIFDPV